MKKNFFEIFDPIFELGDAPGASLVSGLHSGNLGDIIYSLPTVKELGVNHLILNACADPTFGQRILRSNDAISLAKQLLGEAGIVKVSVVATNLPFDFCDLSDFGVDFNLDSFRRSFPDANLHLVYQHALPFGIAPEISERWLTREYQQIDKSKYMVLSLTPRYRRFPEAFYQQLLIQIPPERIWIIGTPADRARLSGLHGNWMYTKDFSNIFGLLQHATVFVGNPSFAYAIAEAMKVRRFVEVPEAANVYPLDDTGHLIHMYHQAHLSEMIKECLDIESSIGSDLQKIKDAYEQKSLDLDFYKKKADELACRELELKQIKSALGWQIIQFLNRCRAWIRHRFR